MGDVRTFKWATDELIPKEFTLLEVLDDRSRIDPCHVRPGDLLAFPHLGINFTSPVHAVQDDWIFTPRRLSWTQTTEEWYVGFHEFDDRPFDWSTHGDFGEWRSRTLRFPITHVRTLAAGQTAQIVGPMYASGQVLADG